MARPRLRPELRPARPPARVRASAGVPELLEGDVARVGRARRPDAPAGRVDDARQAGALEAHARVVPPRPAEVHAAVRDGVPPGRAHLAVGDDVVRRAGVALAARGRQPAVVRGGDGRVGDPRARVLAEDEVGRALDVAVGVQLAARLGEQRVLVPVQADAVVALRGIVGR